jgi:hypothetical protein
MDKKIIELERAIETIDIAKKTVERNFELSKKQMGDQI